MKKLTKVLCVVLALVCVFALTSCGKEEEPLVLQPEVDQAEYLAKSAKVYEDALSEYASYYEAAKAEYSNISRRYALMAIAEAKLMEACVYQPSSSRGGNYAISRVVPNTVTSVLYGNDSFRYHNMLVVSGNPIKSADRAEMKAKWAELKGTGTYESWAKSYLAGKGYQLSDTYLYSYTSDPQTWDAFNTYRAADSEAIMNTYDGLLEYDMENELKPALALSYEVSADGTVYTFHIRQGVKWVDSQGRDLGEEVTAESWVYGLQHLLDAQGGLEYLVTKAGVPIKNTENYMGGVCEFSEVGIKALDRYTLQYTLDYACPFFLTMLGYNPFAPICKSYFESKGGAFGIDEFAAVATSDSYTYGKTANDIAYCGPYLVTNHTEKNVIRFEANPTYWNKDNINIKTIVWGFNDGSDVLKAYNDMKAGELSGCGLNASALEVAKGDGYFDQYSYISATDATSFGSFYNLSRTFYSNFNDGAVVTAKTKSQAERAEKAMQNVHFRRALSMAVDRGAYNAASVGEELKLVSVINSYTPGTFVSLPEDLTIEINGVSKTYPAGTYYGKIMQDQIDADGVKIKVWDPNGDNGIGSSAGFDGWYNPENAVEELNLAIAELKAQGVEVSAKNPIVLDLATYVGSSVYLNREVAYKQSVEAATNGCIIINLTECNTAAEWYYAGYYCDYGYQCNYDIYDCSGWGPDYGDPQTYLNTLSAPDGDMIHCLGIY